MTLAPELRGPVAMRSAITDCLRAWLPVHLEACRSAWGLTADQLPAPKSVPDDPREDAYFNRPIDNIDRWPMLSVTHGTRSQRRTPRGSVDFEEDGSLVSRGVYPIRVYSWVKAAGRDDTLAMRDNFITALHLTLASHMNLETRWLDIDPSSFTQDYSDIDKVTGDRFVAGAYVGFDLAATETLTDRLTLPGGQPRDTVSVVNATGHPLSESPAPE